MKHSRIILTLSLTFFLLFVSLFIWAQPPPGGGGGNGGGGGTFVGPIGGENLLLVLGMLYAAKRYIKPFRAKK